MNLCRDTRSVVADLLLLCTNPALDKPSRQARLALLLEQPMPWDEILAAAQLHRVQQHLHGVLCRSRPTVVPEAVSLKLEAEFTNILWHSRHLVDELVRLTNAFNHASIPVITFKGPAMSTVLLNDPLPRHSDDIDLLIPKDQLHTANRLLTQFGYSMKVPAGAPPDMFLSPSYLEFGTQIPYFNEKNQLWVDLHWSTFGTYFSSFDWQHLNQRSRSISVDDHQLRFPGDAELVLLLCIHGTIHGWDRLSWILDIAHLVNRTSDWEDQLNVATQLQAERTLVLGILLACTLFEMELPVAIEKRLSATPELTRAAEVFSLRFLRNPLLSTPFKRLELWRIQLCLRDTLQAKLKLWLVMACYPTMTELARLQLPRWLFFSYFLIRPLLLVGLAPRFCWKWLSGAYFNQNGR